MGLRGGEEGLWEKEGKEREERKMVGQVFVGHVYRES